MLIFYRNRRFGTRHFLASAEHPLEAVVSERAVMLYEEPLGGLRLNRGEDLRADFRFTAQRATVSKRCSHDATILMKKKKTVQSLQRREMLRARTFLHRRCILQVTVNKLVM
jgi:hypothetical protein